MDRTFSRDLATESLEDVFSSLPNLNLGNGPTARTLYSFDEGSTEKESSTDQNMDDQTLLWHCEQQEQDISCSSSMIIVDILEEWGPDGQVGSLLGTHSENINPNPDYMPWMRENIILTECPSVKEGPDAHVAVWNKQEKRKISGRAAPKRCNLEAYLKRQPHLELYTGQQEEIGIKKKKRIPMFQRRWRAVEAQFLTSLAPDHIEKRCCSSSTLHIIIQSHCSRCNVTSIQCRKECHLHTSRTNTNLSFSVERMTIVKHSLTQCTVSMLRTGS